jgi:hypothetical protein
MKNYYAFLLFAMLLTTVFCSVFGQPPAALSARDVTEIKFLAEKTVELDLARLYRVLSFSEVSYKERKTIVENAYLPGPAQLFVNENTLIEDDIDPAHTDASDPKNLISRFVGVYLHEFSLRSGAKMSDNVQFTKIKAGPVEWNNRRWEVQVTFTSLFGGTYKPTNTPYTPVERVATLWADKSSGKWALLFTNIAFVPTQPLIKTPAQPSLASNQQQPVKPGQSLTGTQSSAFFDPAAVPADPATPTAKPGKANRRPKPASRPATKPQPALPTYSTGTGAKPTAKPQPTKN